MEGRLRLNRIFMTVSVFIAFTFIPIPLSLVVVQAESSTVKSCRHYIRNDQLCPDPFNGHYIHDDENEITSYRLSPIDIFTFRPEAENRIKTEPCLFGKNVSIIGITHSSSPWSFPGRSSRCSEMFWFHPKFHDGKSDAFATCQVDNLYNSNASIKTALSHLRLSWLWQQRWIVTPTSKVKKNVTMTTFNIFHDDIPDKTFHPICDIEAEFLQIAFLRKTESSCFLRVQQYEVTKVSNNPCTTNSSPGDSDSTTNSTNYSSPNLVNMPIRLCGLYDCSKTGKVLRELNSHMLKSKTPAELEQLLEPLPSYNKWKTIQEFNEREAKLRLKRAQTWTITDYILEVAVVIIFILIAFLVGLKMCLSIRIRDSLAYKRPSISSSRRTSTTSERNYLTKPQSSHGPISKCSSKPSCICANEASAKGKSRWKVARERDNLPYAPVRTHDTTEPLVSKSSSS